MSHTLCARADGVAKVYPRSERGQCGLCRCMSTMRKVALAYSDRLAYQCPRCGGMNSVRRIEAEQ